MLFNSPLYIFLFLPLVFFGYHCLRRTNIAFLPPLFLVGSSLLFYAYWKPIYLILITFSMTSNFVIGHAIHQATQSSGKWFLTKKMMLTVGVVLNLSLLGYFKYADFFLTNINGIFDSQINNLNIVLPLAISFFTFQQIAYLVDCYQEETEAYSFLNYALFVSFFPQLIAGPIVHHKEMMPQFEAQSNRRINWANITMGLFIFFVGLFKKVFIADSFAIWANAAFDSEGVLTFFEAWAGSLSYSLQLYYDFSGYSDMAIGAALLFNIRLPVNFDSPYKATNIQEFWRRWHMTLSRWLREYLYIPLGGNRTGTARIYTNLIITFLLGGLWHGAGWTFVIWGLLHGIASAVHKYWSSLGMKMNAIAGLISTLLFLNFTWVFFRAESLTGATRVFKGMLGLNGIQFSQRFANSFNYFGQLDILKLSGTAMNFVIPIQSLGYLLVFGLAALLMPNSLQMAGYISYAGKFSYYPSGKSAMILSLIACMSLALVFNPVQVEFLYFNF